MGDQVKKARSNSESKLSSIRNSYELPSFMNFISVCKEELDFPSHSVQVVEESLVLEGSPSILVSDLLARLLRKIHNRADIRINSYQSSLTELLSQRSPNFLSDNPNVEVNDLSAFDKLRLLKWLSDTVLSDYPSLQDRLNSLEYKEINLGSDSLHRSYWYFHDLRLYRSSTSSPNASTDLSEFSPSQYHNWKCLALNKQQWLDSINELKSSSSETDSELGSYIEEHMYTPIIPALETNENKLKPSDDELLKQEEKSVEKMLQASSNGSCDPNQLMKSENPELSKVLSEEPSAPKDDKSRESEQSNGKGETKSNGKSSSKHSVKIPPPMPNTGPSVRTPTQCMNGNASPQWMPPSGAGQSPGWQGNRPMVPHGGNGYSQGPGPAGGMWGPPSSNPHGIPDITHNRVPDENLTPEQLQRREAGRESLRKIHKMLLADDPNHPGGLPPHMTDFSHINMAQDTHPPHMMPGGPPGPPGSHPMDDYMYRSSPPMMSPHYQGPPHNHMAHHMNMGPGGPMGPNGPMMGPGGPMGPSGPMMGPGGPPMGPGGPPMGPGGPPMGPAGPMSNHPMHGQMHPQMGGPPRHIDMYPNMPPQMMHPKPPPPYPAADPPAKPTKSKKRKNSTQSPAPSSPMGGGQPLKSPKYHQIPQSPLAGPGGLPPNMPPGFPDHGIPPNPQSNYSRQMSNGLPPGPHPMAHVHQPASLMQAGPPEPFQGHPPPSNQKSSKKQGLESMTTPPSVQYYTQFENQELTITKQRNTCYQESSNERSNVNPNSPLTTRSSSINNITSASLANLAKGVEQNINQMQQSMMEGGPFREIQQPQTPQQTTASSSQSNQVNNTYVNAHMSIAQVNIHNVNSTQQMTSFEGQSRQLTSQQSVEGNNRNGEESYGSSSQPSVKVQAKGAGTLQYLPVSQTKTEPALPQKQPSFDYNSMSDQYNPPHPHMDGKLPPTSKMNYYPDNARLPPPPPQRLPMSVNSNIPVSVGSGGYHQSMANMRPGMMSSPPHNMPTGAGNPSPHSQYGPPHQPPHMIPSSMYSSSHGHYPGSLPGTPIDAQPPMGMMEPMPPHMHMSQGPSPHHPMMSPPHHQQHFGPPMDYGPPMHGHSSYDYMPPNAMGAPPLTRQMSHPGAMPPQHMHMPHSHGGGGGGPYPPPPGPYMMG